MSRTSQRREGVCLIDTIACSQRRLAQRDRGAGADDPLIESETIVAETRREPRAVVTLVVCADEASEMSERGNRRDGLRPDERMVLRRDIASKHPDISQLTSQPHICRSDGIKPKGIAHGSGPLSGTVTEHGEVGLTQLEHRDECRCHLSRGGESTNALVRIHALVCELHCLPSGERLLRNGHGAGRRPDRTLRNRSLQRMAHRLNGRARITIALTNHAEFVTAHPVRAPADPRRGKPQRSRELDEHSISGCVPEAVVVRLESVEIGEHEEHGPAATDGLLEISAQRAPIAETGECVAVHAAVRRRECGT